MRRASLALTLLLAACGNDASNTPAITPSVSAIQPSTVYLGRTVDVHLSGFATMWMDGTTLSFGDGITVNKVTAGSPTGLTANITIATTAMQGPRDVTVMDGSNNELFKSTFTVGAPIKVSFQGSVAQGSLSTMHIDLLDNENLFDTTNIPGFLGPPTFTNIDIKTATGVLAAVQSVSPTTIDAVLAIDVDAAAGPVDIDIASGPAMSANDVHTQLPAGITVVARTALPLPGGITQAMESTAFDSQLYTFAPGAATLTVNQLILTATGGMMPSPSIYRLPKSGHFADWDGNTAASEIFTTKSTDPFYVIVWDGSGASGYSYTATRNGGTVTAFTETATNNTANMADAITMLPALIQNANLDGTTDTDDWFSFTTGTGDAGKKAHLTSFSTGGTTLAVAVTASNGTTIISTQDLGGDVDLTTTALAASTTYKVHVSLSTMGAFGATPGDYNLWLRLE
jgi:hypothetical protein